MEFLLSKTVLIVFGLAVLIASGSMISSLYSEQESADAAASLQQIAGIMRQSDSLGGEYQLRLDMRSYLSPGSVLRIGDGALLLTSGGQACSVDISDDSTIKVLGEDGIEAVVIDVTNDDILVIERRWDGEAIRTMVYIENVDATFSTASTNRSTSSTVL